VRRQLAGQKGNGRAGWRSQAVMIAPLPICRSGDACPPMPHPKARFRPCRSAWKVVSAAAIAAAVYVAAPGNLKAHTR